MEEAIDICGGGQSFVGGRRTIEIRPNTCLIKTSANEGNLQIDWSISQKQSELGEGGRGSVQAARTSAIFLLAQATNAIFSKMSRRQHAVTIRMSTPPPPCTGDATIKPVLFANISAR